MKTTLNRDFLSSETVSADSYLKYIPEQLIDDYKLDNKVKPPKRRPLLLEECMRAVIQGISELHMNKNRIEDWLTKKMESIEQEIKKMGRTSNSSHIELALIERERRIAISEKNLQSLKKELVEKVASIEQKLRYSKESLALEKQELDREWDVVRQTQQLQEKKLGTPWIPILNRIDDLVNKIEQMAMSFPLQDEKKDMLKLILHLTA